jgi:uncharacterized repeat protein (TIGR01451 family)
MFKQKGFVLLPVVVGLVLMASVAYLLTRESTMNVEINSNEMKMADTKNVAEAGIRYAMQDLDSRGCSGYPTNFGSVNLDASRSFTVGQDTKQATTNNGDTVYLTSEATIGTTKASLDNTATVYGDSQQQTTPAIGPSADTYLDLKFPAYNASADPTMSLIEKASGGLNSRPILKFDLASVPQGSRIVSASLQIYANTVPAVAPNVNLHKISTKWDPAAVTWSIAETGKPWTAAGGDYDPTPSLSQTISVVGWQNFDVTGLVNQWVNKISSNYGLILLPPVGANISFASSEHANVTWRPKLTVTFVGPRQHFLMKDNTRNTGNVDNTGNTGKDTFITRDSIADPAKNFGKDAQLVLDNGPKESHALIKFNLAPIPDKAKLLYANLVVTVSTPPTGAFKNTRGNGTIPIGAAQISVHKMLQDWKEGTGSASNPSTDGVSWDLADKSSNKSWTSPTPALPAYDGSLATQFINSNVQKAWNDGSLGGYYDTTFDAQYPIYVPYPKYVPYPSYVPYSLVEFFDTNITTPTPIIAAGNSLSWDITPLMSEWMALSDIDPITKDKKNNFGLIIRADSALAQAKFHSFDNGAPLQQPRIEMAYWMPCGTPFPPQVTKAFASNSVNKNQPSTLTITLNNPNTTAINSITVTDDLPSGLNIVTNSWGTTCPGSATTPTITSSSTSGYTSFTVNLAGRNIPANSSCTITANAISNTAGSYTNIIRPGGVASSVGANTLFASATLKVNNTNQVTLNTTADTAIWKTASLATSNCGVCTDLAASTPNANQVNSLFKFDLSGIPAASTVTNAKLRLYVTQIVNRTAGQALTLQASPVTASWLEGTDNVATSTGGATWKRRSTALGNWATQGGDFAAVNFATTTIPGSFAGTLGSGMWVEFDVTAAAQAMVTNPATNFGFHVQETTVLALSNEVRLASRENTPGTMPQLVVSYN